MPFTDRTWNRTNSFIFKLLRRSLDIYSTSSEKFPQFTGRYGIEFLRYDTLPRGTLRNFDEDLLHFQRASHTSACRVGPPPRPPPPHTKHLDHGGRKTDILLPTSQAEMLFGSLPTNGHYRFISSIGTTCQPIYFAVTVTDASQLQPHDVSNFDDDEDTATAITFFTNNIVGASITYSF